MQKKIKSGKPRQGQKNVTEKIKETEADTEYYFDENGYLKVKKIKADDSGSNTENEQDNAPDVRDVHRKMIPMRSFRKPLMQRRTVGRADTGHIAATGRADAGCNSRTVNHRRKMNDVRRKNCKLNFRDIFFQ